jgi:hypothetical protein
MSESTEHVTIVPADLYDEMMDDDSTPEGIESLRNATERAREMIVKRA